MRCSCGEGEELLIQLLPGCNMIIALWCPSGGSEKVCIKIQMQYRNLMTGGNELISSLVVQSNFCVVYSGKVHFERLSQ